MLSHTSTIRARWAAGLLCVLALGACSSSSKKGTGTTGTTNAKQAATLLNKALQEQVSGNTSQAEKDFTEVVRLDPKNKFGGRDPV